MTNQIKTEIVRQLVELGKYDELSVQLRKKLYQTGWIDELRGQIQAAARQSVKFGAIMDQLDLDELYNEKLESQIKEQFAMELQSFLLENFEVM